MTLTDIGGTLAVIVTALVAGGAGYKFLEKVLDLWATGDVRTSSSWREYAEKLETRLDATEADQVELRRELDAERKTRITQEDECARRMNEVWKHVGRLERIIRDAGLHVPGDTPPPSRDTRTVNGKGEEAR